MISIKLTEFVKYCVNRTTNDNRSNYTNDPRLDSHRTNKKETVIYKVSKIIRTHTINRCPKGQHFQIRPKEKKTTLSIEISCNALQLSPKTLNSIESHPNTNSQQDVSQNKQWKRTKQSQTRLNVSLHHSTFLVVLI